MFETWGNRSVAPVISLFKRRGIDRFPDKTEIFTFLLSIKAILLLITVESVAHLLLTVADLQTYPNPLQDNPAYSVVK
jgi:hypothetical protein